MPQVVHNINESYGSYNLRKGSETAINMLVIGVIIIIIGIYMIVFDNPGYGVIILFVGLVVFFIGRYGRRKMNEARERRNSYPTIRVIQD